MCVSGFNQAAMGCLVFFNTYRALCSSHNSSFEVWKCEAMTETESERVRKTRQEQPWRQDVQTPIALHHTLSYRAIPRLQLRGPPSYTFGNLINHRQKPEMISDS